MRATTKYIYIYTINITHATALNFRKNASRQLYRAIVADLQSTSFFLKSSPLAKVFSFVETKDIFASVNASKGYPRVRNALLFFPSNEIEELHQTCGDSGLLSLKPCRSLRRFLWMSADLKD